MPTRILIFEDIGTENLLPLTWTRPSWGLRCGIVTLARKIAAAYPGTEVFYHARPYLAAAVREDGRKAVIATPDDAREQLSGPVLLINGRVLADADLAKRLPLDGPDEIFRTADTVVAVRLADGAQVAAALENETLDTRLFSTLREHKVFVPVICWPWDLVAANAAQIEADFRRFTTPGDIRGDVSPKAILEGRENLCVGDDAVIEPGAILLADKGPIFVGPGACIMAGAVIEGPVAVCTKATVKVLSRIYEGTTVGPLSKVGGEVEASIFHACSNKQHDGFLGHSYIGSWCNLGAGSCTSDLKNTYSNVKVSIEGVEVDTGSLFCGLTMGDHSKTGIGTMLNTGSVMGVGCNIFGGEFPPKDIPSFLWGGHAGLIEHDFEKFCQTAERVMARRNQPLTLPLREMLEYVFHQTRRRRRSLIG
jgi:UDP-N-acetylglucosamine diphosphorylase / glucose-1-phosphate thymidylyltransferase / UDP-N-acetylgalactosamine diphosphorylase / glucosamine-1-phosphate N-acetyltransferase / galactosamine-1-phosphate N-acetyltransferase